jgi:hypothetical protein
MRVGILSARRAMWRAGMVVVLAAVVGLVVWATFSRTAHMSTGHSDLCYPKSETPPTGVTDSYDRQVLSLAPVLYLPLGHPSSGIEKDLSGNGYNGAYLPAGNSPAVVKLPNGDPAVSFNGVNQYVQVASESALSVSHTDCLTVQAWIRPGTLQFSHEQGTGYVNFLGKGTAGKQEYALRMYSLTNTEVPVRPNRISAYAFNLSGGLGSGSYFQNVVTVGQWIMVTCVIDDQASSAWPDGYISIYKDGGLRGQVSLGQYDVKPQASDAPFRIATRDLESYFQGAIAKVAVYDYVLSSGDISATYDAMVSSGS